MTPATFDETLQQQADVTPSDIALVDARARLSYGELNDRVNAFAQRLQAAGTRPGHRVVLIADNSTHHAVVAFALWRAGATLVTIYPSSTVPEFEYAIDNAQPMLVIAGSRVVHLVRSATAALGVPLVELTTEGTLTGLTVPEATAVGPTRVDPNALALICYTSGSTSRPKAVMHSHSGLLAAATSYARVWHLGPADTTMVALPMAWAFGLVTTTMAALTSGGRVLLLARSDPDDMLANLTSHEVTVFAGVTTMFVKMVGSLDRGSAAPTTLRLCISGGEPRNDATFDRWQAITGCPVHDVYAASECFPVVTYDPELDPAPKPRSAGRVVPDAQLRLVGPDGADAGPSGPGEAWVRGPALMLGYWRDPELTSAVLTPDGWYRMGDLVEVDSDGYVHVVGRLTDLIIRGGANVSPAEVEAVLVRHPLVREASVVGLPDAGHGQRVVAAVVFEDLASAQEDTLRAHCAASLASYKVPSRVVPLDELPRNVNTGKVQRREVAELLASVLSASSKAGTA